MLLSSFFAVTTPNFLLKRLLARVVFLVRRYALPLEKLGGYQSFFVAGASPCGEGDGVKRDMSLFVVGAGELTPCVIRKWAMESHGLFSMDKLFPRRTTTPRYRLDLRRRNLTDACCRAQRPA